MIFELKNLTPDENGAVLLAPALVTLLIAGAEGNIDEKEMDWGNKITHFRANDHTILQNYYQEVDKNFNETLLQLMKKLPMNVEERSNIINNELAKLNDILPKLDPEFAKALYKSLLSLSNQIARASGGVWGLGSISPEEKKHLNLEAINPIE